MDTPQFKIAPTEYNINDLIKNRFSPRTFSEKEITEIDIKQIIEAAQWAPSAINEQPWRYKVALKNNKNAFDILLDILTPSNQIWAKNASVLVFCYSKLTYSSNEMFNPSALHDTGMANQNLLLQALSMNIYGRMMGGFDKMKAKEVFQLSENFQPVCLLALGYLGNGDNLSESIRLKEKEIRIRKSLKETLEFL